MEQMRPKYSLNIIKLGRQEKHPKSAVAKITLCPPKIAAKKHCHHWKTKVLTRGYGESG